MKAVLVERTLLAVSIVFRGKTTNRGEYRGGGKVGRKRMRPRKLGRGAELVLI